jgi:peptidoglycan/LPS O-acetylase OafA/YrhL
MKREKLEQLAHIVAGGLILIYGFQSFEAGEFIIASYYLSLAIIFMLVAGAHTWISQKFLGADVAFFLLEACTIVYTGWHYKTRGHEVIFYIMFAAGLLYFVFALISISYVEKPKRKKSKKRRRKHLSSIPVNPSTNMS